MKLLPLTDDLNIRIIEIVKFSKDFSLLSDSFEHWVYLLKEANKLGRKELNLVMKKNPKLKKAIDELKFLSQDKKTREYYDAKLIAELDYNTDIRLARTSGINEGIEKGLELEIESLLLGIQLLLENKFNSNGLALLPKIKKIKDNARLKNILKQIGKATNVSKLREIIN